MAHVGGHLREEFQEILEDHLSRRAVVTRESVPVALLGALWNCTDVLPSGCCEALDMPHGSSYAQAVQSLR